MSRELNNISAPGQKRVAFRINATEGKEETKVREVSPNKQKRPKVTMPSKKEFKNEKFSSTEISEGYISIIELS